MCSNPWGSEIEPRSRADLRVDQSADPPSIAGCKYEHENNESVGIPTVPRKSPLSARAAIPPRQYQAAATRFKPSLKARLHILVPRGRATKRYCRLKGVLLGSLGFET